MQKLNDCWRLWRDHLRWSLWDDLLVTAVILAAPVAVGASYWVRSHQPTRPAPPAQNDALPPRIERTIKDGYVYVRKLGPVD